MEGNPNILTFARGLAYSNARKVKKRKMENSNLSKKTANSRIDYQAVKDCTRIGWSFVAVNGLFCKFYFNYDFSLTLFKKLRVIFLAQIVFHSNTIHDTKDSNTSTNYPAGLLQKKDQGTQTVTGWRDSQLCVA